MRQRRPPPDSGGSEMCGRRTRDGRFILSSQGARRDWPFCNPTLRALGLREADPRQERLHRERSALLGDRADEHDLTVAIGDVEYPASCSTVFPMCALVLIHEDGERPRVRPCYRRHCLARTGNDRQDLGLLPKKFRVAFGQRRQERDGSGIALPPKEEQDERSPPSIVRKPYPLPRHTRERDIWQQLSHRRMRHPLAPYLKPRAQAER